MFTDAYFAMTPEQLATAHIWGGGTCGGYRIDIYHPELNEEILGSDFHSTIVGSKGWPYHKGGFKTLREAKTFLSLIQCERPKYTNEADRAYDEHDWLDEVIRALDKNDPCEYCPESKRMKAIWEIIKQSPENERISMDSYLAQLLRYRLDRNTHWRIGS